MALARDVSRLRAFNRFYTSRLGLLRERPYDPKYTLAETRVLFELAHTPDAQPAILARELGLDRGYLSRILARLGRSKLIARRADDRDGRSQRISLTAQGKAAFAPLDRASREQVSALLAPLSEQARHEVTAAVSAIESALGATPGKVTLRDPAPGDLGWIVHRHGKLYFDEYGWDRQFEALVADIVGKFARDFDPKRERAWVADRDGAVVGSVFLVRGDKPKTGKLRLLYVEPTARGHGIGRRLVDACIAEARRIGYRELVLWTNDVLASARRIYRAAGFELVKEAPHRAFGHDLVEQTWLLRLEAGR